MLRSLFLILLAPVLCPQPHADTLIVLPDGSGEFPTIQAAVDASSPGDIILLGDGVFLGAGNRAVQIPDRQLTIQSASGNPDRCIIDCETQTFGLNVRTYNADVVLRGFTITRASGGALAVYCPRDGITVEDCVFLSNSAEWGGAVGDDSDNGHFIRCRFIGNSAISGGAYVASNWQGSLIHPTFEQCEFIGNSATDHGGAVFLEVIQVRSKMARDATFRDCLFFQNSSPGTSCVTFWATSPSFSGCTFAYNEATSDIGCWTCLGTPSNPPISNCVFAFGTVGRAIDCDTQCHPTLTCCDIFGNHGGNWVGVIADQQGTAGNLCADPLFCDPFAGDLHIELGSPCAPDANPECGLIGLLGVGCGSTPIQQCSWGRAKALFR